MLAAMLPTRNQTTLHHQGFKGRKYGTGSLNLSPLEIHLHAKHERDVTNGHSCGCIEAFGFTFTSNENGLVVRNFDALRRKESYQSNEG